MVECLKERMCMVGSQTVISSIGDYKNSDLILMFIPGNPGVIGFYDVFFEELYRLLKVPIVGVSHGGHCAQVSPSMFPMWYSGNYNYLSLDDQITHKSEFAKTILSKKSRLILMGHSIGAHMVLKLMEEKEIQKRVNYSVLLFPALEHLCLTPAGRFWTPVSKYGRLPLALLAHLVSYTPTWLKDIFIKWRAKGRPVHNKLLKACYSVIDYSCMNHALYMAATEMDGMNEMEESVKEVIRNNTDKLTFYYGNPDHWAPLTYYDKMKNKFPGSDIRLCKKGFPHDFVLDSSESVARICSEILQGKVS